MEKPGQFELRGRIGVLEAIAIAGGFKTSAKHSQVVLFRRYDDRAGRLAGLDVKTMEGRQRPQNIRCCRPGDFLLVPKNRISKVERFLPLVSLGAADRRVAAREAVRQAMSGIAIFHDNFAQMGGAERVTEVLTRRCPRRRCTPRWRRRGS